MTPTANPDSMSKIVQSAESEAKTSGADGSDDLRRQLEALRADLASVTSTLAEIGKHKGDAVAGSLRDGASKIFAAGEEKAGQMAHAAGDIYAEYSEMTRRNPATALGIAAGVGFIVGLLLSRR